MTHTTNYNLNQWEAGDRVTRADFNADNAAIDAALAALAGGAKLTTGSYVGDGTNGRVITLPFAPKAMFLIGYMSIGACHYDFALLLQGKSFQIRDFLDETQRMNLYLDGDELHIVDYCWHNDSNSTQYYALLS